MNGTAFKIAASTIICSMTMVACTAQSEAMRRMAESSAPSSRNDRQAAQSHDQARRAFQQGQLAQAVAAMENAVALSPRDAGYRLFLADVYMKSGRFESARATFADVLELDPASIRAGLSLALMHIALGRPQAAVAHLDELSGRASAADLGLAYALAGMPQRAVEILEPAARSFDATPRLRQNLALSYALAGDWQRARTVAAQDLSPAELNPRLQQWAALASPVAASNQVASLIGVNPVQDPGQPVRLALAPPVPAPASAPAVEASVAFAAADSNEAYIETAAQAGPVSDWGLPPEASAPVVASASYELPEPAAPVAAEPVRPEPTVVRTASAPLPAPTFRREAPRREAARGASPFVVQLGAFSNEGNAERAWQQAERRFGLAERMPLTTTININGRTLHRVSVAGFASRGEAAQLCASIRGQGGSCFVRTNAGDASVRWAARYAEGRNRDA